MLPSRLISSFVCSNIMANSSRIHNPALNLAGPGIPAGTDVPASPYYLESGGTVIDWELVRRARKRASKVASG